MSLKMNPFGVGYSAGQIVTKEARCRCCGIGFSYQQMSTDDSVVRWCEPCVAHHPVANETLERRLARLEEHEPRLLAVVQQARDVAARTSAEVRRYKAGIALAHRDREVEEDRRRAAESLLSGVLEIHVRRGGRCQCGLFWPCATVEVLKEEPRLLKRLEDIAEQRAVLDYRADEAHPR